MSLNLRTRIKTSCLLFLFFILVFINDIFLLYALIITSILSLMEFINLSKKIFKKKFYSLTLNISFILYISLFCYFFFLFANFVELKIMMFIILAGCMGSDIGGYVFGNIFKGPKLVSISPKKTIAGAIGSILCTIIIITGLFIYFFKNLSLNIILVSILVSIFCQFGDLLFSFLKRKAKVKDTGNFLPGHGGLLDRLDGIYFGLPFGLLTFLIIY